MADLFDNPMGLQGFEFVEFATPEPKALEQLFTQLGFTHIANHRQLLCSRAWCRRVQHGLSRGQLKAGLSARH